MWGANGVSAYPVLVVGNVLTEPAPLEEGLVRGPADRNVPCPVLVVAGSATGPSGRPSLGAGVGVGPSHL